MMINAIGNVIGINGAGGGGETAGGIARAFTTRVAADGGVVEAQSCLEDRIQNLKTLGLWDKASAVWMPHGYKEGKLYAVKGGSAADLSFSRNGTRTRKGPSYVEEVPYNFLTRSEDLTIAWVNQGSTDANNVAVSPRGDLTASALYETVGVSPHRIHQVCSKPSGVGIYTFSVSLKGIGRDWCKIVLGDGSSPRAGKYFNLSNGTAGSDFTASVGYTLLDFSIIEDNHGFYRVSITCETSASAAILAYIHSADADGNDSFEGDVSKGLYVWGAQLEEGTSSRRYFNTSNRFNVPALDYTNSTCPSLSLEPARTNLAIQSENLDNGSWTTLNLSVAANAVEGPNGLFTADAIVEDASNAVHRITGSATVVAGSTYTFSVYAKQGSGNRYLKFLGFGLAGALECPIFDLTNKVVYKSGSTTVLQSTDIVPVLDSDGNETGWVRCIAVVVPPSTTGSPAFELASITTDFDGESYQGDGVSSIYLSAVQVELGAYATSYIPTTTGTVTRIADKFNPLVDTGGLIGQTEGTLYWEGEVSIVEATSKCMLTISDGTTANRVFLVINTAITLGVTTLSAIEASLSTGIVVEPGTKYKVAGVFRENYAALFVNGIKIGEDTSVVVPSCSEIRVDSGNGSAPFYGASDVFFISKEAISDAEAITLTTV